MTRHPLAWLTRPWLLWTVLSGWVVNVWAWLRNPNRSWDPNPAAAFFGVHVALALSVVFFVRLLEWRADRAELVAWPWWVGGLVVVAWAVVKEFWFDILFEPDTELGSTTDFLEYMVGAALGLGLLWALGL